MRPLHDTFLRPDDLGPAEQLQSEAGRPWPRRTFTDEQLVAMTEHILDDEADPHSLVRGRVIGIGISLTLWCLGFGAWRAFG